MGSVSLTGEDVIQIDGRILNDLGTGDAVMLDFPNDLAVVKRGKNGNTVYAFNELGAITSAKIRVLLGSSDDKYLNARLQEMRNGFSTTFILVQGMFVKSVGDGQRNVSQKVYNMTNGIFKKIPTAKTSAEGDTEQSEAEYTIEFGNATPSIQ
jgi:hypothetical protein